MWKGRTNSSINKSIAKTYAQLAALIGSDSLVPEQTYKISDFRTRHIIPNSGGAINIGAIEPLIVKAATNNSIYPEAVSTVYASDQILYEFVDSSTASGDMGRIYRRYSPVNNIDRWFDWRAVKYRRWQDPAGNYTLIVQGASANHQDDFTFGSATPDKNTYYNIQIGKVFSKTDQLDNISFKDTLVLGSANITLGDDNYDGTFYNQCLSITMGRGNYEWICYGATSPVHLNFTVGDCNTNFTLGDVTIVIGGNKERNISLGKNTSGNIIKTQNIWLKDGVSNRIIDKLGRNNNSALTVGNVEENVRWGQQSCRITTDGINTTVGLVIGKLPHASFLTGRFILDIISPMGSSSSATDHVTFGDDANGAAMISKTIDDWNVQTVWEIDMPNPPMVNSSPGDSNFYIASPDNDLNGGIIYIYYEYKIAQ